MRAPMLPSACVAVVWLGVLVELHETNDLDGPTVSNTNLVVQNHVNENTAQPEDPVQRYIVLLQSARDNDERRAVLTSVVADAQERRRNRQSGYGVLRRFAAFHLVELGDAHQARRLLITAAAHPETSQDAVSCYRMLGQMCHREGDSLGAARYFESAMDRIYTDPQGTIDVSPGGVQSVITQYVPIARALGKEDRALEANAVLIGEYRDRFDPNTVRAAFGTCAAIFLARGETEQAAATYETLFQLFPTYGLDSDAGLGTRLKFLKITDPSLASDDYVLGLQAMWDTAGARSTFRSIAVGQELVMAYERRHDVDAAMTARWSLVNRCSQLQGTANLQKYRDLCKAVLIQTLWEIAYRASQISLPGDGLLALDELHTSPVSDDSKRAMLAELREKLTNSNE